MVSRIRLFNDYNNLEKGHNGHRTKNMKETATHKDVKRQNLKGCVV